MGIMWMPAGALRTVYDKRPKIECLTSCGGIFLVCDALSILCDMLQPDLMDGR